MTTELCLAAGLSGINGCCLLADRNRLLLVDQSGRLASVDLLRHATILSSGITELRAGEHFDFERGGAGGRGPGGDLWWDPLPPAAHKLVPWGEARLLDLGIVDFNSLGADALQQLSYGSTPVSGAAGGPLAIGSVLALRTTRGHYTKLKLLQAGDELKLQWVTYRLAESCQPLAAGYQQPQDVKATADGAHAYITERSGQLLRVALAEPSRTRARVIADGLAAPQQLFVDEALGVAYVAESGRGRLLRIELADGKQSTVAAQLDQPLGVTVSADRHWAYVSTRDSLLRIEIGSGARATLASDLNAPSQLTWADEAQTALLIAERGAQPRVLSIAVATGQRRVLLDWPGERPASLAIPAPGRLLMCTESAVLSLDRACARFDPAGPLLLGIGLLAPRHITTTGLADTADDPDAWLSAESAPFGGRLPLRLNHLRACAEGAVYYRIKIDGKVRSDPWVDERWNGRCYLAQTMTPTMIAGQPGYYPLRPPAELYLWRNPSLGSLIDSTSLSDGQHALMVEFAAGNGALVDRSRPLTILIDNRRCIATLAAPQVNGEAAADDCGLLSGAGQHRETLQLPFLARHPAQHADVSLVLNRGIHEVPLPAAASSPVQVEPRTLLAGCRAAGFVARLHVAARATNGWYRQSQYDADAVSAFVLAP